MWAALARQPAQSAASNAQPDPLLSMALGINMIEHRDHCRRNPSCCLYGWYLLSSCGGYSSISVNSSGALAISRRQPVHLGPWESDVHRWAGGQQYNFALYLSRPGGTTWNGILEPYPAQRSDTAKIQGHANSSSGNLNGSNVLFRDNKTVRFSEQTYAYVFGFQNACLTFRTSVRIHYSRARGLWYTGSV